MVYIRVIESGTHIEGPRTSFNHQGKQPTKRGAGIQTVALPDERSECQHDILSG